MKKDPERKIVEMTVNMSQVVADARMIKDAMKNSPYMKENRSAVQVVFALIYMCHAGMGRDAKDLRSIFDEITRGFKETGI